MPGHAVLWCNQSGWAIPACCKIVKGRLNDFKTKGMKYEDGDLGWRHVGVRNGQTYLMDPRGSLEECRADMLDIYAQMLIIQNSI